MDLTLTDQQIVLRDGYGTTLVDGRLETTYTWATFGIAGLQLFPEMAVEVVLQFESLAQWESPLIEVYSSRPDHNWDDSYWDYLGLGADKGYGRATNQVSFLIGPGMMDFRVALDHGETGVIVQTRYCKVTGLAWRYVPVSGPQGALTPGGAPALTAGTVTAATPQGTSAGPGLRLWDEALYPGQPSQVETNARWWKFIPEESGWYVYSLALSNQPFPAGWDDGYVFSSAYWFQGVPAADGMPIAHSNYDEMKGSNEAYGLVELQAGQTYYLKVLNKTAYASAPEWRVFVDRATWFCGHAGPDPYQAKVIVDPDGFCTDPIPSYGFPAHWFYETPHQAWWTFVAPRTGPFKATAMLTRKNGAPVNQWWMYTRLFSNDPYWTGMDNPLWIEDMGSFPGDGDWGDYEWVEEGKQYWIMVAPYYAYNDIPFEYVLQTKYLDHEEVAAENQIVFARDDGNIVRSVIDGTTWTQSYSTLVNPWEDYGREVHQRGFQGYMELWRSFGGPQPGEPSQVANAFSCVWPKARLGQGGTWWWSNGNGVEWLGSATCPSYVPVAGRMDQSYSDAPVGFHWHSEGGTYGEAYIRVWATAESLCLHELALCIGAQAGLNQGQLVGKASRPFGEWGGFVHYYSTGDIDTNDPYWDMAELVKVEVAADQGSDQWANPGQVPPTEWYMISPHVAETYDTPTTWGPYVVGMGGSDLYFAGGPQGAESIAAEGQLLTTYSGGTPVWQEVPGLEDWWADEEDFMASHALDVYNMQAPRRMFVGINSWLRSSAAPPTPPAMTDWNGPTVNHYVARLSQVLCFRLTVRSKPVLVTWDTPFEGVPGARLPDCGWEWPQSSITGAFLDDRRQFTVEALRSIGT